MTETAKVYGDALYDLTVSEGLAEGTLGELRALDAAFSGEPAFLTLLSTPSISKEERSEVLDRSFRGNLSQYTLNFLKLLTQRDKIREFSGCCKAFTARYYADNGILPVRAVSAVPISPALRERLEQKLRAVTGKRVEMTYLVDPACLGGVRLDMDGEQLDGTVRRRLDDIRSQLKNTVL